MNPSLLARNDFSKLGWSCRFLWNWPTAIPLLQYCKTCLYLPACLARACPMSPPTDNFNQTVASYSIAKNYNNHVIVLRLCCNANIYKNRKVYSRCKQLKKQIFSLCYTFDILVVLPCHYKPLKLSLTQNLTSDTYKSVYHSQKNPKISVGLEIVRLTLVYPTGHFSK